MTRWGFCLMMSQVSASKSGAPEASRATPAIGGSGVEVGSRHDGLCDPLATNTVEV